MHGSSHAIGDVLQSHISLDNAVDFLNGRQVVIHALHELINNVFFQVRPAENVVRDCESVNIFVLVGICTGGDRVPEVRVAQLQNLVQLLVGKADQVIVAGGIELGNGSGANRGN